MQGTPCQPFIKTQLQLHQNKVAKTASNSFISSNQVKKYRSLYPIQIMNNIAECLVLHTKGTQVADLWYR